MRLICVRHGESAANAGAKTSDPLAIELTALGRDQAEGVARQWAEAPAWIVTSPARRALDTAAPTIARFGTVPVQVWPIEEFTYLSPVRCAGTSVLERRQWVETYWSRADPEYRDGADAETFEQFIARVRQSMERLLAYPGPSDGLCALFGHGQFINAMRWSAQVSTTPLDMRSFRAFDLLNPIANCQLVALDLGLFTQRRSD